MFVAGVELAAADANDMDFGMRIFFCLLERVWNPACIAGQHKYTVVW